MVTTLGWFYLVGGTILFFFWAYGIVSFALDCKHKFLPAIRNWLAARAKDEPKARDGNTERDPTPEREPDAEDQQLH